MYAYGLIGNCQTSALVSASGSIDWLCFPLPDSDPVFARILDPEGGHLSTELLSQGLGQGQINSKQYYLENTNILITELTDHQGNSIRITDFCPRFEQYGRMYRPMSLFRIIEPTSGSPMIKATCMPVNGWAKEPVKAVRGNSHLEFEIRGERMRLSTNLPLIHLCEEIPFRITEKIYFGLTWSSVIENDLQQVSEGFLIQTKRYWQTWVKHCSIPTMFQTETIRSALALKLHCYEDTGAILAAVTTSLPEEVGTDRNWDYRYCWLRDSHFVLSAFHKLGHFEEMEGFLKYFLSIAQEHLTETSNLSPVYSLRRELPLPERIRPNWGGYLGSGPVRTNNQAAEHIQNDVYGEMLLTLAPIFFDQRFAHLRTKEIEALFSKLAPLCSRFISQPDAGIWEIRNGWREHTFTNLMCWAGLDRVKQVQKANILKKLPFDIDSEIVRAVAAVEGASQGNSLRNGPGDESYDAALALATALRFPNREICKGTIDSIQGHLALGSQSPLSSFFYRYVRNDDFGRPNSAFVICSYWMAQAYAEFGLREKAQLIFQQTLDAANHVGLFSEHYDPIHRKQLGNFPQAYSHVGLVNAAFSVSPSWSEVL
jgi:GH15 family glucan-1,4-alpha-glucosidase